MKAVILAGGFGTRLSEETALKPKPMVEIGGKPLLWHIMKTYSAHGVNDFVICLGYKGYVIKEFFTNYFRHMSDMTVDLGTGEQTIHQTHSEPWRVSLIDTGSHSMTGGRLKRVRDHLDDTFCFTYGDGVADIDISKEIEFHKKHKKLATVAAVQPPGRFGVLDTSDSGLVESFEEKPNDEIGWINGGFFVLEPAAIDFIDGDDTSWEREPLRRLAQKRELMAFYHTGFWRPCDTLRDKNQLEEIWNAGSAPWNVWD